METIAIFPGRDLYRFCLSLNKANMYVLFSERKALIIDCFYDAELRKLLRKNNIEHLTVLLTHEHWDHASGVEWLKREFSLCNVLCGKHAKESLEDSGKNMSRHYKALLLLHNRERKAEIERADIQPFSFSPDLVLENGEEFEWEKCHFKVYSTPGHTKGSVCFYMDRRYLFTGDSLVNGNKTITRFLSGSREQYESITVPLFESLSADTKIFPGHGAPDCLKNIIRYIY